MLFSLFAPHLPSLPSAKLRHNLEYFSNDERFQWGFTCCWYNFAAAFRTFLLENHHFKFRIGLPSAAEWFLVPNVHEYKETCHFRKSYHGFVWTLRCQKIRTKIHFLAPSSVLNLFRTMRCRISRFSGARKQKQRFSFLSTVFCSQFNNFLVCGARFSSDARLLGNHPSSPTQKMHSICWTLNVLCLCVWLTNSISCIHRNFHTWVSKWNSTDSGKPMLIIISPSIHIMMIKFLFLYFLFIGLRPKYRVCSDLMLIKGNILMSPRSFTIIDVAVFGDWSTTIVNDSKAITDWCARGVRSIISHLFFPMHTVFATLSEWNSII